MDMECLVTTQSAVQALDMSRLSWLAYVLRMVADLIPRNGLFFVVVNGCWPVHGVAKKWTVQKGSS